MKRALPAACALAFAIGAGNAAHAWQKFEDYRILGTDLRAVKAIDPEFNEDPAVLELVVGAQGENPVTLQIETDGILEDCARTLQYIIGDPNNYAQIIVQTNASTMNGTLIVQCSSVGLR